MDLLGALGAAPARLPAKDGEAPEAKAGDDQEQTQEGFDEAMNAVAANPSEKPAEPNAAAPRTGLSAPEIAFLLDTEDAEVMKDAADAEHEVDFLAEAPPVAAQIDLNRDTQAPAKREGADIDLARPAPSLASPTAAPIAPAGADLTASPGAPSPPPREDNSKAVRFFSPTPLDAAVPGRMGAAVAHGAKTSLVEPAAAVEDKTAGPETGRTTAPEAGAKIASEVDAKIAQDIGKSVLAKIGLAKIGAAPAARPDVGEAVLAALQEPRSANPHVEALPGEPSDAQGKPTVALSAPAFTQAKEKPESALAPTPTLTGAGERAITAPDPSAQTPTAPKPETHHPLAQAGQMDAARQVIAAIRTGAGGDGIEVRLDPPDLGRVRIHFTMERADSVVAVVSTDRSDTLDTMRRHAGDLVKELSRAGFADVHLEFKSGGERSRPEAAPKARIAGVAIDDDPVEKAAFVYARARLDGRLDRLV